MSITAADCQDVIEHALAGGVDSRISAKMLTNLAGRYFLACHPWAWAVGRAVRLSTRAPITLTGATWTEGTLTLTKVGAFAGYTYNAADAIRLTSGTGVLAKTYPVASRTSDDAIVLGSSIDDGSGTADGATDVAGTITFDYVELPADFGSLIAVQATDSLVDWLNPTTLRSLLDLRSNPLEGSTWHWWAAISHTLTPGAVTPIFEVYPAPDATEADVLTCFYRARWAELPFSTPASELVTIPRHLEGFFFEILRQFAFAYEEEGPTLDERLARLYRGPMWMAAVYDDAQEAEGPDLGPPAGGALGGALGMHSDRFLRSIVQGPS